MTAAYNRPLSDRPLLSERDAADYLGISQPWLRKQRRTSARPAYVRMGRRVFYRLADLDDLIHLRRVDPEGGGQ